MILAFDTTRKTSSLVLLSGTTVLSEETSGQEWSSQRLLKLLENLCSRESVNLESLTKIVIGTGPGSFTGIRSGIATAKGLGEGLGVPVIGISSFVAGVLPYLGPNKVLIPIQTLSSEESVIGVYRSRLVRETELSPEADPSAYAVEEIRAPVLFSQEREEVIASLGLEKDFQIIDISSDFLDPAFSNSTKSSPASPARLLGLASSLGKGEGGSCCSRAFSQNPVLPLYIQKVRAKTLEERGIMSS